MAGEEQLHCDIIDEVSSFIEDRKLLRFYEYSELEKKDKRWIQ